MAIISDMLASPYWKYKKMYTLKHSWFQSLLSMLTLEGMVQ